VPRRKRRTAQCYVCGGAWWRAHDQPQVLPFLRIDRGVSLSHKTSRSADDLHDWFKRIPKNDCALVYLPGHADGGDLQPIDRRSHITQPSLSRALVQGRVALESCRKVVEERPCFPGKERKL
jgi:hypothetical protein